MCKSPHNRCLRPLLAGQEELDLLVCTSSSKNNKEEHSSWCHEIAEEIKALLGTTTQGIAAGLLYYMRNLISMLFLGRLGASELAAGALSIGFANITGYSVISGLAIGMEPICGQAYGAQNWSLMILTLHRTILILLLTCIPISLLWLNVSHILLHLGQDPTITHLAKHYLLYAIPDLIALSFLHPLRIFFRTRNLNHVPAICATISTLLHIPLNYYLVIILRSGIKGVATAVALTDFIFLLLLLAYIRLTGECKKTLTGMSMDCFKEWSAFFSLAIPSCISVCLEWWWYEFMIILCGLLNNPEETVSAIGILMQMTALVYVFPSSLSYGVSTRVAQELGAGRPAKAKTVAYVGSVCGVLMGMAALVFNVHAKDWWGAMFTDSERVVKLVAAALPVVGLCELGNCPQTAMCGAMRGSARAKLGAHLNLGCFYGVGMPVALLSAFWAKFGLTGLWLGLMAAQGSCVVVLAVVMVRTDWNFQAKQAAELTGLRGVEEGDYEKMILKDGNEGLKGMVEP
ncbi:hypothetical protein J5N97_007778 [Dioscorea zingiberensis]|uniref:Protein DETOXIFICATION n=1 Tax=Dioscorea zingiberensis TaxID=325984 RepID=A0A9D5DH64_9LILI|nr:hypothetical protein J5N97_007778 [Dioscorea zingiberensis]